ncbi:hypothetical protein [Leeia oryzae]|nr:hypothetical protein [Leeia oryzae]
MNYIRQITGDSARLSTLGDKMVFTASTLVGFYLIFITVTG